MSDGLGGRASSPVNLSRGPIDDARLRSRTDLQPPPTYPSRFGGSRQAGIITIPNGGPIFIVTGDSGKNSGYHDRTRPDGVFEYFGQGAEGDMEFLRGNAAIANNVAAGRSLLLFKDVGHGLRFEGEMVCEGYHFEQTADIARRMRRVVEAAHAIPARKTSDLADLQRRAYEAAGVRGPRTGTKPRTVYERAAEVRDYVLGRAGGHCEGCRDPAPFVRADGSPYLEPHHLTRVSDGGPDHPAHVIALCPNCHRRVHFGADGGSYNSALTGRMATIEVPPEE